MWRNLKVFVAKDLLNVVVLLELDPIPAEPVP